MAYVPTNAELAELSAWQLFKLSIARAFLPGGDWQLERKYTPASEEAPWTKIETLVHGPGAGQSRTADDQNSAVFACLMAIALAYPEPKLRVYKERQSGGLAGKKIQLDDSPLQQLLEKPTPNGELTMDEMLFWTAWAKHIDGNAYWKKIRAGDAVEGNVIELWPISPTRIKPVSNPGDWVTYYKYQWGNRPEEFENIDPRNIIHFRLGVDDKDMRKGLAPLKALVRQVSTDEEADKFVDALLKNYAIPGLVVIPNAGTHIPDQETADEISGTISGKFSGENRGKVAVLSKDSRVEQFGFSPDDMNLQVLHRVPEERISAVIGVPAIVAGLGAGLDSATYSNARQLGEWFTERRLVPLWNADATKLNVSLKPDFTPNPKITIGFDLTEVRALQEDEDSKYKRLQLAVSKPWMTRNEAREDIGLDPIDGWDDIDTGKKPAAQEASAGQGTAANGTQPDAAAGMTEEQQAAAAAMMQDAGTAAAQGTNGNKPNGKVKQLERTKAK